MPLGLALKTQDFQICQCHDVTISIPKNGQAQYGKYQRGREDGKSKKGGEDGEGERCGESY